MSCYHPLVGLWSGAYTESGKKSLRIVNPLKGDFGSTDPLELIKRYPGSVLVPCNHCIGCKLDYSRSWADRMMLELEDCKKAIFVTLTYDCRHVVDREGKPIFDCPFKEVDLGDCPMKDICSHKCRLHGSLFKSHVQIFMKDLRSDLDYHSPGTKVRFYAVGEYGDVKNSHRPHYHIILFGIGLDDLTDKVRVGFNELRQEVYTCSLIKRNWPYGFISVGDVSWRSCAYVARYVTKKALDLNYDLYLESLGKNPMFSLMSRRPGIGKPYLDAHPDCLDNVSIPLAAAPGVKQKNISIPKYFIQQLNNPVTDQFGVVQSLYNPDRYDKMVAQRLTYANNLMLRKLQQTDLPYLDYLDVEEKAKLSKIRSLKRYV